MTQQHSQKFWMLAFICTALFKGSCLEARETFSGGQKLLLLVHSAAVFLNCLFGC